MVSINLFGYVKFVILLILFYSFIATAYSDQTLESRKEPGYKKPTPNSNLKADDSLKPEASNIVSKPQSSNSSPAPPVTTKATTNKANVDKNNKQITKRQQYSQAKPVQEIPNRRAENPKKRADACPLCDSSVFSYCSDKLLHDACCCLNPFENDLPYQCQYADCSFLHANSCREHHLITSCCCDRFLF